MKKFRELLSKKNNRKGFTLAELLIVVAIIAVLVAISIPIFTSQLEKSREATDLANARSAYAELMVAAISEDGASAKASVSSYTITGTADGEYTATVPCVQQVADWQTTLDSTNTIGGLTPPKGVGKGKSIKIIYKTSDGSLAISAE